MCTACEYEYIYDIVAPTGHDFTVTAVHAATCRQNGSTTYSCGCGFSYVGDYIFYSDIYKGAYVENKDILYKGVDTSYHNHNKNADGTYAPLDWSKIKSSGYDYAILRAGYMGVKDLVFEMDYADAKAAGLELGAYFYSYAYSVEEAREEALFCLELLDGKQFEYPIYFDIEDERLEALGKDTLTAICVEFISILQENGYYTALYTNNKWLTTLLHKDQATTLFDIWYARYPTSGSVVNEAIWNEELYGKQMAMWQFSNTGTIKGITKLNGESTSFDLNYCYKDYPTLIKGLGYNNFSTNK
jgi:GH25 family lysozyme M1 (1,4-beta-N-acetylmuramidase)